MGKNDSCISCLVNDASGGAVTWRGSTGWRLLSFGGKMTKFVFLFFDFFFLLVEMTLEYKNRDGYCEKDEWFWT